MTPIEQHLEDYDQALMALIAATQTHPITVKKIDVMANKLKAARKKLADHITACQTAHSHSQYELSERDSTRHPLDESETDEPRS